MMRHQSKATVDDRLAAVRERRADADGQFVYGVLTTGIYCRPSCPSRQAKDENIRLFDTPALAARAGFRACKRCRPDSTMDDSTAQLVIAAARLIDDHDDHPTAAKMARQLGVSTAKLTAAFRHAMKLSYPEFVKALKARRLRDELGNGMSATEAVYQAGYGSMSRVYERTDALLGMNPSAYAHQGKGERLRYCVTTSDLGLTLIAWTARGIACILFGERSGDLERTLAKRFAWARIEPADKAENANVARVVALIDDPASNHDLPLDIRGTAFQERVWKALTRIPPGSTRTYREIAEAIGEPAAVRAVANACGANRLPVAIPCHRVVRSDGGLGGYAFGEERKRWLLGREKKA